MKCVEKHADPLYQTRRRTCVATAVKRLWQRFRKCSRVTWHVNWMAGHELMIMHWKRETFLLYQLVKRKADRDAIYRPETFMREIRNTHNIFLSQELYERVILWDVRYVRSKSSPGFSRIQRNSLWGCEMNLHVWGYLPVTGFCEHHSELLDFLKGAEFSLRLSEYSFPRELLCPLEWVRSLDRGEGLILLV